MLELGFKAREFLFENMVFVVVFVQLIFKLADLGSHTFDIEIRIGGIATTGVRSGK